jgi:hypothetical protein
MNVVVGSGVSELVGERGGRLFVWLERPRCCGGGVTYLSTGNDRPREPHEFRSTRVDGFELAFDGGPLGDPDELNLEVRGRRRRHVEAYWNGCVFAG